MVAHVLPLPRATQGGRQGVPLRVGVLHDEQAAGAQQHRRGARHVERYAEPVPRPAVERHGRVVVADLGLARHGVLGDVGRVGHDDVDPAGYRAQRCQVRCVARVTGRIRWHDDAQLSLGYARAALTGEGDLVVAAGNVARGVIEEAHSRCCARGEWVTNEKGLVERAGLGVVAAALARRSADGIHDAVDRLADELVHALV